MDDFVAYMKPVLMTLYVIMTKIMKVKHTEDITNDIVSSPLHVRTVPSSSGAASVKVWFGTQSTVSADAAHTVCSKYAKTTAAELDLV
jgi:hypothetical protein